MHLTCLPKLAPVSLDLSHKYFYVKVLFFQTNCEVQHLRVVSSHPPDLAAKIMTVLIAAGTVVAAIVQPGMDASMISY